MRKIIYNLKQLNINFYLLIVTLLLTLAASGFYYQKYSIPKYISKAKAEVLIQSDISAMPKQSVLVVKEGCVIGTMTQFTPEVLQEKIEVKEIPTIFLIEGAINSTSSVENKYAKYELSAGQQITQNLLSDQKRLFTNYDRLKEFEVTNLVLSRAGKGSLVDLIINYDDGDYDVVLIKKYIVDIKTNESGKNFMVFEVDEIEYRDLQLAQKLGNFEIRLYLDEDQPASAKTFRYEKAINRAKIAPNADIVSPISEITIAE